LLVFGFQLFLSLSLLGLWLGLLGLLGLVGLWLGLLGLLGLVGLWLGFLGLFLVCFGEKSPWRSVRG
jgi:hypothetical protein